MTGKTEVETESEAWKKSRDAANKATMASSEALKNDALTDIDAKEAEKKS